MKQKATFQRSGTYLSSEIVATIVKMSLIFFRLFDHLHCSSLRKKSCFSFAIDFADAC